jgi:hypothetical protein
VSAALAMPPKTARTEDAREHVRAAVQEILRKNPRYLQADAKTRSDIASKMIDLGMLAAGLASLERDASSRTPGAPVTALDMETPRPPPPPSVGPGGEPPIESAAVGGARAVQALRDAIDFPTFVTSLIQGIFESIMMSNIHQMERLSDLLDNVSMSSADFDQANIDDSAATQWALSRFPFLTSDDANLQLRQGVEIDSVRQQFRAALGPTANVGSIDESNLNETLLPLIRAKLGRSRLSTLSTLVQLGLQRIVVDEGRMHASMDLRVDTSQMSERDRQARQDWRVNAAASGHYSVGIWGVSASVSTSIGRVESDHQYTQQQLASRAGLRSSVDLAFRTEQIPLDRMASRDARARIDANSRVPAGSDQGTLLTTERRATPVSIENVPAPPQAPDSHFSPTDLRTAGAGGDSAQAPTTRPADGAAAGERPTNPAPTQPAGQR